MEMEKPGRFKRSNMLITIFALFSVSPFINTATNLYLLIMLFFLVLVSLNRTGKLFLGDCAKILIFMYALLIAQAFLYKGFSWAILYVPLITFYLPTLILQLVGLQFFSNYVRIMYIITMITTPIWILQSLFPSLDQLLRLGSELLLPYSWGSVPRSLIFYTTAWSDDLLNSTFNLYRNSGAFHEPGAYGIFLNLAIILNTFFTGRLWERKNIVFMFCLLTTFSTAGYITYFVIVFGYLIHLKTDIGIKLIAVLSFVCISLFVYQRGDFLQSKVKEQLADQTYIAKNNLGKYDAHSGRFYAFYTSVRLFAEHPLLGRGILYATSEKATGEMNAQGSYTYGFMGLLSTYGLLFGLTLLVGMYKGFNILGRIGGNQSTLILSSFLAINLALMSQVFITSLIMLMFFVLGFQYQLVLRPKTMRSNGEVQVA